MTVWRVVMVLAVAWIGVVALLCLQSWPTIPLDLDARDPALLAVYRQAGIMHALRYTAAALVPVGLVLAVVRLVGRRGGEAGGG